VANIGDAALKPVEFVVIWIGRIADVGR